MQSYGNIIRLPHPQSPHRKRMPLYERAAQFAPFAALTGFDEQIFEEARLTDARPVPGDEDAQIINDNLNILLKSSAPQRVRLTYFQPDGKKQGGALLKREGEVRRIDTVARVLIFTDKTLLSIDDILTLDIL